MNSQGRTIRCGEKWASRHLGLAALGLLLASAAAAQTRAPLPLAFEPNVGQADGRVRFLARGPGMTIFLTDSEVVMLLQKRSRPDHEVQLPSAQPRSVLQAVIRMKLAGARPPRETQGLNRLPGVSNYYLGDDPRRWRTDVPQFEQVSLRDIYPGIDLLCYGQHGKVEYDFVVAPGADPRQVRLAWEGVDHLERSSNGDLLLTTPLGRVVQQRPRVFQDLASGRVEVAAKYVLEPGSRVGFALAEYDRRRPLVIDPSVYSTYLGGKGFDVAYGIAVNSGGEAYVTGSTSSVDFPILPAGQTKPGSEDVYVAHFASTGDALLYSTFLGGGANDNGLAIALDAAGSAYVTGTTNSNNFPIFSGFQRQHGSGFWNAFVAKLTPAGALAYSTYLGGNGVDQGRGIAVDSAGNAYVTGITSSTNFPTQGAYQNTNNGSNDAFVAKLSPTGSSLVYSTYLGGKSADQAQGIAVDDSGSAYVAGTTDSSDFPVVSAFQPAWHQTEDAFVAKLAPSGASLTYSTYLGGSGSDSAYGIAVDSSGAAYVAGRTLSADFPVIGAYQPTSHGNYDAFVTKLVPAGNALAYSTYLGGSASDAAWGIAIDGSGQAYVTGWTQSTDFPTLAPVQTDQAGDDAFVAKLNLSGSALVYSTYLGGSGNDYAQAIAVDVAGAAYVAGWTDSNDFPTQAAFQGDQPSTDAFVTKIADVLPTGGAKLISPTPGSTFAGSTVTFTWSPAAGATAYGLGVGTSRGLDNIFQQEVGTGTSQTVTGIPTNGSTIWVRLATQINGGVLFNDYSFKAFTNGAKATMTSPAPGSVLSGATVTFTWMAGTGASSYRLDVGTAAGQGDIFSKTVGLATTQNVTGIPTDGSTIYVRLTTVVGSYTFFNDYTYIAFGGIAKADMVTPASGATLGGASVTFTWNAVAGAKSYLLWVGTTQGQGNLYNQETGLTTSQAVSDLPTDGSTIYVRLWTLYLGHGGPYNDYTYTAAAGSTKAAMITPANGTALGGASVTFTWSAASGATTYWLDIGTTAGGVDLRSQGTGLGTSLAVTGLPTNGSTICVRLWTEVSNVWQSNDYTYTASGGT
ncbi:MAG TPA: SBBP repeat-containing protein [Opitutaceae bacterium]|nr:SBBP repeat-containing protein [Opitutaceae bacterium]